jgi:hydroxyquinol 1,2-dioxygenase
MRHIDEDTITQAVIARHTAAQDARLREVMTSLVQHLHAFAREVRLTDGEWLKGIRFLAECGRLCSDRRQEFVLLSDTLGLSMLVTALNHRKPSGCTEATTARPFHDGDAPCSDTRAETPLAGTEPLYVRGRVCALDGAPVAGAEVRIRHSEENNTLTSAADGTFQFKCPVPAPHTIPHDGPVGRMLQALGRHPWRPAHLHFMISAPGYERLVTHVFRSGSTYLDSDAVFGVRRSLEAEWVRQEPGPTPDGLTSDLPFYTLEFAFVLNTTKGDTPWMPMQ